MAEVETVISSAEFIRSLEKNRSALNSAFEYHNSGSSRIESADVFNVFTGVLNPLYDNGIVVSDRILISIFNSLLKLISKKLIGKNSRDKELEKNLFIVAERYKNLLAKNGGVFLLNIINVLLNLNAKKNIQAGKWVSLVTSLPENITLDEFRRYGFIAAWICGAAGARETAAELIRNTGHSILKILFNTDNATPEKISEIMTADPWRNPASAAIGGQDLLPVFKTAGGFRGYGCEFRSLPAVVSIDGCFYASDGIEVFRLYGDYFGIELVRDKEVTPENIKAGGVINRFVKERNFICDGKSYPLPPEWKTGITSIAFSSSTVAWTLNDSYKIYIAGLKNNA